MKHSHLLRNHDGTCSQCASADPWDLQAIANSREIGTACSGSLFLQEQNVTVVQITGGDDWVFTKPDIGVERLYEKQEDIS
jgi:hypothetical protein